MRRLIAVIAAYAIALQAFVPLAIAAVPGDFPICTNGSTGGPKAPIGHGHDAAGAACCVMSVSCGVLPAPATHVLLRLNVATDSHGRHAVIVLPPPRITPHAPRPPPAA